jgi:hypothetical protein
MLLPAPDLVRRLVEQLPTELGRVRHLRWTERLIVLRQSAPSAALSR